jgi:hypothetical protein
VTLAAVDRLRALVYLSSATQGFTQVKLDELAARATDANAELGITGVLTYRNAQFIQYIEGPAGQVEALYLRLQDDSRHTIRQRVDVPVVGRRFHGWGMELLDPVWLPSMNAHDALHDLLHLTAAMNSTTAGRDAADIIDRLATEAAR